MNLNLDLKSELKPACCSLSTIVKIYDFHTKCPTSISCYICLTPDHAQCQGVQVNVAKKNLVYADDMSSGSIKGGKNFPASPIILDQRLWKCTPAMV